MNSYLTIECQNRDSTKPYSTHNRSLPKAGGFQINNHDTRLSKLLKTNLNASRPSEHPPPCHISQVLLLSYQDRKQREHFTGPSAVLSRQEATSSESNLRLVRLHPTRVFAIYSMFSCFRPSLYSRLGLLRGLCEKITCVRFCNAYSMYCCY